MELSKETVKSYFAGEDEVSDIEDLEILQWHSETEVTVRIWWVNEISDWKLNLDEDGSVLDAYNYNTVIEY